MLLTAAQASLAAASLAFTWFVVNGCTRPLYGYRCLEKCGATLTDNSGTIHSPGYNTQYLNNESCSWNIIPQTESSSVLITFQSFSTEGLSDFLSIFAYPPTNSTLVARYSGNELPYQVVHEGPLHLHFTSNHLGRDKGFEINYSIVDGIAPRFVSDMNDTIVVARDNVLLPCPVTGIPEPDVTWYKDGLEVHSILQSKFTLEGKNLSLKSVMEEDAGVYKCRAENFLNSTEQTFLLTVYVPPLIAKHPMAIHLESIFNKSNGTDPDYLSHPLRPYGQQRVVFRCSVYGVPKPVVYWKKDGEFLLYSYDQTYSSLVIEPSSMSDTGDYSCFANNTVGSAESRPASLTIGELLPCCLYLYFPSHYVQATPMDHNTTMTVYFDYRSYTLSKVAMTKDGQSYLSMEYRKKLEYRYHIVYLEISNFTERDIGVYGWHLHLSSPSSPSSSTNGSTATVVSSYVSIVVQGPPLVAVSPSNVVVRDFDEQLNIACSAYSPHSSTSTTLIWLYNNRQVRSKRTMETSRRIVSYITISDMTDRKEVENYRCRATNSVRLVRNANMLVIEKVSEEGYWSGWTETSQCSKTCGSGQGITLRRRRCFNDTHRCPGPNIDIRPCSPPVRCCPSTENKNTELMETTTQAPETNVTQIDRKDSEGSSLTTTVVASVVSAVLTGIASAVIATALTYWYVSRKNRNRMTPALDSLTTSTRTTTPSNPGKSSARYAKPSVSKKTSDASSHGAKPSVSRKTSDAVSHGAKPSVSRKASDAAPHGAKPSVSRKTSDAASHGTKPSVSKKTSNASSHRAKPSVSRKTLDAVCHGAPKPSEKATAFDTNQDTYEPVLCVSTPSNYTPLMHSTSQFVEETLYEAADDEMATYLPVSEGAILEMPSSEYLIMASENTLDTSDMYVEEEIYVNT